MQGEAEKQRGHGRAGDGREEVESSRRWEREAGGGRGKQRELEIGGEGKTRGTEGRERHGEA